MSLLRRIRAELAGACRSVRYDLGRRPAVPPAHGPDMTSTGLSTFGGYDRDEPAPRPPRRAAAATALGVLTVVGAAGAYLCVVNGLGSLLHETPASADTLPPRPAATGTREPVSGIGGGPRPHHATAPRPASKAAPEPTVTTVPTVEKQNVSPVRTPVRATRAVAHPPVPTPTAPAPPTATAAGPSPSEETPEPSESASATASRPTPDETAEPSESARRSRQD